MKRHFLLFMLILIPNMLFAAGSAGTVGFEFLRIHPSARPSAMAGAFVAISGDQSSIYFNPAGIAEIDKRSGSFSYVNHILDLGSGYISYVNPKFGPGNLGVGIHYMDYGDFDGKDAEGRDIGTFGANSISFAFAYAAKLDNEILVGGSFKYIHFGIDNWSADAIAFDAGAIYHTPIKDLNVGISVSNVGQSTSAFMETKDDLPLCYRAGFSKRLAHLPLLFAFNLYKYPDYDWHGALGGEFTLTEYLFLRLGYDQLGRDLHVDSSKDRFAGVSIGLGLLWRNVHFDYSFSSVGIAGSLNRVSVSGSF